MGRDTLFHRETPGKTLASIPKRPTADPPRRIGSPWALARGWEEWDGTAGRDKLFYRETTEFSGPAYGLSVTGMREGRMEREVEKGWPVGRWVGALRFTRELTRQAV
jgi:hypothetical protein